MRDRHQSGADGWLISKEERMEPWDCLLGFESGWRIVGTKGRFTDIYGSWIRS
jgi:hypothetical protein